MLRLVPRNLRALLTACSPAAIRQRRRDRAFDAAFGVDTAGSINVSNLDAQGPSLAHASRYQAAYPGFVRELLQDLGIDCTRYSFVDLGAGKGRVVFVAAEFPFRRVIGVEFAASLCRIAEANVRRYSRKRCADVRIVHADAAAFVPPDDPLVIFMYNPFYGVLLRRVIDRLRPALSRTGEPSLIVYMQPDHRAVLDQTPELTLLCSNRGVLIYRTGAVSARP